MVRQEFDTRKIEIENYFNFLKEIEQDKWISLVNHDLSKVLKANGFLLLYNLIESCVYYSIKEIFEEIEANNLKYTEVISQIKLFWLKSKFKNQENQTHQNIAEKFKTYIEEIIQETILVLEIERIDYGGSLTPQKIRKISNDLGINFNDNNYKKFPNGKALTNIKDKRNDLVHGKSSFGEIGRNLTFNGKTKQIGEDEPKILEFGLTHYKDFTIVHLSEFINSVETYILNQEYRKV